MEQYCKRGGFLEQDYFAILDERSVRVKTVRIHYLKQEIDDDETVEEFETNWYSWRIRFGDAYEMTCSLSNTFEMWEEVFLACNQFTGEDGIFDYQKALKKWLSV
jgi:hypothetical protein